MGVRQQTLFDYAGFVDKFERKKTTDECMTPEPVYEVVRDWACERYGVDPGSVVRPFWPDTDYASFDYPDGCCVIDNPPFSKLASICEWYLEQGIGFFLFAPALTAFSARRTAKRCGHVFPDASITYDNGAVVRTAFVTSLSGDVVAETAPELGERINAVDEELRRVKTKQLPKYDYPDNLITAAKMCYLAKHGQRLEVRRGECEFVGKLDAAGGKSVYGGAMLVSDAKAAERAAAERAAAVKFELSPRERAIVDMLGGSEDG